MLKLKDGLALSRAIDKMGIADQVVDIYKSKANQEEFGIKLIALIGTKLHKAQAEIVTIIASSTGKTAEEVEEMSITEIIDVFKGFFAQEGVKDFLSKYVEDSK
jgi:hypothetical protein